MLPHGCMPLHTAVPLQAEERANYPGCMLIDINIRYIMLRSSSRSSSGRGSSSSTWHKQQHPTKDAAVRTVSMRCCRASARMVAASAGRGAKGVEGLSNLVTCAAGCGGCYAIEASRAQTW